ncbi:hypothetical protein LIQ46_00210 [Megasphaera elsdenii]|uniref:hypothetical protein n=1 Tax=Megasphaera elsdenii TaxID=907 RepID=UPI001D02DDC8|nr:hypothetical protein [Megasphaera elsdenii]MCB5701420.1 hypothetical protein [Megasphaera elsdenii]MCB5726179.1 hypothetical protein [Megasphaera elsdenii]MCB5770098.1 hypothetical protein [Megasphaera elsdenii]
MKKADVEKKMTAIKEAVEKRYPGVMADVKLNEWQKSGYHRLYIDLDCKADVNGTAREFVARFGFINLETNRYSAKNAYNMKAVSAEEITEAKMLSEYASAYKEAEKDDRRYTANSGYREVFQLSEEELENGISAKEMLDKSFENGVSVENIDTCWLVIDSEVVTEDSTFIGSTGEKEIIEVNGDKYIVLRKYGKSLITGVAVKVGDHFDPFGAVDKYRIVWENGKITLLEPWGEKIWRAPNQKKIDQPEAPAKVIEDEKIGSYDGRIVTISPSDGKYSVEDNGKYTGDYGRDFDDGVYEAAMYLYDWLVAGKAVKVANDEALNYIIDAADGMDIKIVTNDDGSIKKED